MRYPRVIREERGAVAIIVAVSMIAFLALTALVVDYGYLAYIQRKLQTAADSAALAGAQELIISGLDENAVYAVVKDYAEKNGVPESEIDSVEIDSLSVKVTVARDVNLFFAAALGHDSNLRSARAKARIVWISGLGDLVPFGVVDVRPTEVWVGFGDSPVRLYDDNNDSVFTGSVGVPATEGFHDLEVESYNYPDGSTKTLVQEIDNAAVIYAGDSPIKRVTVEPNPVRSSETVDIEMAVDETPTPDSIEVTVGGSYGTLAFNRFDGGGSAVFSGAIFAPAASQVSYSMSADIIRSGETSQTWSPVSYLRVMDSEPFGVETVLTSSFSAPAGSQIDVSVFINGFEVGEFYDMKLMNNSNSGNFYGLTLDGQTGGAEVKENIVEGSETEYYIGNSVLTQPGNMIGPSIKQGLQERIGNDGHTWESWLAESKPDCPRVVTVPLVSGYEGAHGREEMVITGFARLFIAGWNHQGDSIQGYFVDYPEVGVGWQTEDPNDPLRPKTVRLVPTD